MDIFNRYILKLKVNGLKNCGLHGNLLLNELFVRYGGTAPELVQGYITVGESACWHVWVELEGQTYDVVRRFMVDGGNAWGENFAYLREKPEAGAEEDAEVSAQYELYTADKAEFWRKSSYKMRNLRAKTMRSLF